jgi:hypothetical protein
MTTPSLDISIATDGKLPPSDVPTVNFNAGLTISLALNDQDISDHLLITFAKPGAVTCPEMLNEDSTARLLYEIEQKGQNVTEAALIGIADGSGEARRLFVTPCPGDNFRDYAVWVGMVTETVINLKARKIALYPCPGALTEENAFDLTCQLVRSLMEAKATDHIALVVGRYNYNKILNMALELRAELKSSDLPVQIIH